MAKAKKQTTAHAKELKRVRQFINRAEKRGFRFSDDLKKSIKDFTTRKLKSLKPEKLYSMSTALSETGEIVSGSDIIKQERSASAKKSAETRRKIKEKIERKPTPDLQEDYYPDGGDIIYGNVVEEFIERLQEPTPEYSTAKSGREFKKPEHLIQESNRQKTFLLNLTFRTAQEIGTSALGWRLQEQADTVNSLTNYVLYGSTQAVIQSAATELAQIIKGSALTLSERIDLSEQEEYNESFEEPD